MLARFPHREDKQVSGVDISCDVSTTTEEDPDDACCFFDHFGINFGCYPEKQWFIPWCPGKTV